MLKVKQQLLQLKLEIGIIKFNGKIYKTEAAARKAKTMEAKRNIKQAKQEVYAQSEKKTKRDKTMFTNKLNKIISKHIETASTGNYFITSMIQQSVHYRNKYSKAGGYKKEQLIRDSQVIQAKNLETAKQKYRDDVVKKYSNNSNSFESAEDIDTSVSSIEFINITEQTGLRPQKPSTMFLKSASPMVYNFTTEERKYLKFDGHCVEDNLIGIYGPLIKKFTKPKLIELATEFYKDLKL